MDGVTEKFSVFDFFNLIIVGIIFITILGIANYYQAIIMLKKIAEIVAEDKLLEAGTIIVFLCVSLVIGMIFQVMFQYIKEKMNLEKEILSNKRLFDNEIRMEEVKKEAKTSVYKGYKQDKIEMRGDRAEMSDFPLYLNTVAGGLDRRDQTIGGFSFVVKIYAVPVVEIIG